MTRVARVCVAVGVACVGSFAVTGVTTRAQQGARIIQVADLADMALGAFHNSLFRYPIDHIVNDRGVRMGSLGSDIFHDPADSYNEFWAVTAVPMGILAGERSWRQSSTPRFFTCG